MREIKFRAKRLDNGEWISGDLHLHTPFPHIHSTRGDKAKIDTDTIGQFTGFKDDECLAPTQSLLQRWLREENGYYVYPFFDNESRRWTWVCRELTGDKWIQLLDFEERYFDTYEHALEDALKYTLENLV